MWRSLVRRAVRGRRALGATRRGHERVRRGDRAGAAGDERGGPRGRVRQVVPRSALPREEGRPRPPLGLDNPWVSMGASPEILGIVNAYRGDPDAAARRRQLVHGARPRGRQAGRLAALAPGPLGEPHRQGLHLLQRGRRGGRAVRVRPRQRRRRPVRRRSGRGRTRRSTRRRTELEAAVDPADLPSRDRPGRDDRLLRHQRLPPRRLARTQAARSSRTTRISPTRASSATGGSSTSGVRRRAAARRRRYALG